MNSKEENSQDLSRKENFGPITSKNSDSRLCADIAVTFSATMMVGALVLSPGIRGMIKVSATRR